MPCAWNNDCQIESECRCMNLPARYEYSAVIPHKAQPCIFLVQTEHGWSLPGWETACPSFWQSCGHLNQAIHDLWNLQAITLRCLVLMHNAHTGHPIRIYEIENRDPQWSPPSHGAWIGISAFKQLHFTHPEHRALLETWFLEQREGFPLRRRAWARPGWFDETVTWMDDSLRRQGIALTGEVEQVRTWERSCLLRVRTSVGLVYCKGVSAMFAHELPVTLHVSRVFPARAPTILSMEPPRRLWLMGDFGGPTLNETRQFAWWEETMGQLASIQVTFAAHTDELLAVGCPLRPLDTLADDLRMLLADTQALSVQGEGLTPGEIAGLRQRLPFFLDLCQELATYRLPLTLEHGDLGPTNVAWVKHHPLFFDWSDSSITHPFFSLCCFPEDMEAFFALPSDWQARQRSASLHPWAEAGYGSLERLETALSIAQLLAPLHHASRYHRFIFPCMEAPWEMALMIPAYLRCLFSLLKR